MNQLEKAKQEFINCMQTSYIDGVNDSISIIDAFHKKLKEDGLFMYPFQVVENIKTLLEELKNQMSKGE